MSTRPLTRGGLKLETHKRRSTRQALRAARVPDVLILPLDQHVGVPAKPIVAPGEIVTRGQPIAEPDGEISAWLHAPVAGRVRTIEEHTAPHHPHSKSLAIVLENDGSNREFDAAPRIDPTAVDAHALREHIALGGIVGLGGAIFPTGAKLRRAPPKNVHLIVNGAECEPWISCDDSLMRARAADVLDGAEILCRALEAERCTIAVEDDMLTAAQALRAIADKRKTSIEITEVPTVYPAGGERQLITALTGLEVPSGGLPQDIGVICQNVATAAAVAHWVRDGQPLIRRIVTVTGSAIKEPANLEALLGTPFAMLIEDCGGMSSDPLELIMGGTMMGVALPDASHVVVKGTNCVLAVTAEDVQRPGMEMPCIRCGACSEVCPAFLLPQQLHRFTLAQELTNLDRYGLLDCIECGCCDYVCPSQIPLVERFRIAKPALRAHLDKRQMALDAKANYEARDLRLARLEAERREKLAEKRKTLQRDGNTN